jgi:hypothetical protein
LGKRSVIRICTAAASYVGPCDHCSAVPETTQDAPEQIITVVTLQRGDALVFAARFCEKHFLRFYDVISDQVADLLYPKPRAN